MKRIFSFIILIFLIHGVAIRAFTPRRGPDHILNFELLPLEENVLDIEEANLTLDFRNLEKDDDYAKVDFLAEYRINNPGITQNTVSLCPLLRIPSRQATLFPKRLKSTVPRWNPNYISEMNRGRYMDTMNRWFLIFTRNF